ncbi:unnamed protein product, partial [Brenthis ino]
MSNRAWVTLATNDSYGLGALVLAHSLRRASSAYPAVVLITPSVTEAMRERLRAVFAEVVVVDVLDSRDAAHLALLQRPELGITFTKIHCWSLTQYEKCVFLDADALVVQNCDELFEREELSAAPDVGWPDCFNSGVFVFRPSAETFSNLVTFAAERGSFDGGDQGLLNSYFSDWAHGDINKHLPFLYNVTSAAFYSYIPALKHYGQNLKIIHFIGAVKPWLQQYNWESRSVDAPEHLREFLQLWWDLFASQVHSQLDTHMDEGIVEEHQPTVLHQEIIEYNDEPASNVTYYEPILDAESEFPWHHPENQVSDSDINVSQIDTSQFYDPWNIYRGNIPPSIEDFRQAENKDDYEDMRKYAWDYVSPQHSQNQSNVNQNYESPHEYHQVQPDSNSTYHSHSHRSHSHHSQSHHSHSHQSYQEYHEHQESAWQYNSESSQNNHQYSEYAPSVPQSNYEREFVHEQNTIQTPNSHHENEQQHSHSNHEPHYPHEYHYAHIYEEKPANQQSQDQYKSQTSNHIPYSHDTNHNTNASYNTNLNQKHSKEYNKIDSFTYSQLKNTNRSEQIYTVMMDHVRIRNSMLDQDMNGYASDSDSDIFEEIRPRHPYDGFYLRHRMTIDSHGRKICSHEIPFIPRTPSPASTEDYEDALESLPEEVSDNILNGDDLQTGVAGNLARVVPGIPLQREAVDELTRRQGWEAGNIDYMGADSFDNIWAKISQTLSQPPETPSEQAPPAEQQAPQEEAKPESSEPASVELVKEAEPIVEKEPVPEVPAEKPVEALVEEVKEVPAEVPQPESEVVESAVAPVEATPSPVEEIEVPVPASEAAEAKPEESIPIPAEAAVEAAAEAVQEKTELTEEIPVAAVEALKIVEPAKPEESAPAPTEVAEPVPQPIPHPRKKFLRHRLLNLPRRQRKRRGFDRTAEERRKPAGKLLLRPAAADTLPTPDSELEDAAALAHAIISSELRTPTVTSPTPPTLSPSQPAPPSDSRLSVQTPEVPTPPVSLSQIGVKPKASTAAQIESSVSKAEPKVETDVPKKKIVRKVVKSKESASGDASTPVPPPRKKEKKPKEK